LAILPDRKSSLCHAIRKSAHQGLYVYKNISRQMSNSDVLIQLIEAIIFPSLFFEEYY
jgi:hypothetical protein